jgi:hypothetical protein
LGVKKMLPETHKLFKPLFVGLWLLLVFSCNTSNKKNIRALGKETQENSCTILNDLLNNLTETVVDDGFSPPVASRIYAYPGIAFYETIRFLNPKLNSFSGKLNGLQTLPVPDTTMTLDYRVAAIQAFSEVAKKLTYRANTIEHKKNELQGECFKDYNDSTLFKASVAYGNKMAAAIIAYMSKDNYIQTRTMAKYTCKYKPGTWIPTSPMYNEAIEPHFMELRPLTLDSCSQFKPEPPVPFSTQKGSAFYKQAMEVYDAVNALNDSTEQVTRHWDCNPVPSTIVGHLKYIRRQLTPGGHWIWITGKVCEGKKVSLSESAEIHALVAIGLMDAFISCWDEKFRSERIRPETYIKDNIDRNWKPFLETPQFPEYTSGHSVVSSAAATILTHYFGDNVAFMDSAEVEFGLIPMQYNSFNQAADEAMISRFLAGIHYKDACVAGRIQGRRVGEWVLQKLGKS